MTLDGREQRELASTCSLDVRGRLAPPGGRRGRGILNPAEPEAELTFHVKNEAFSRVLSV